MDNPQNVNEEESLSPVEIPSNQDVDQSSNHLVYQTENGFDRSIKNEKSFIANESDQKEAGINSNKGNSNMIYKISLVILFLSILVVAVYFFFVR